VVNSFKEKINKISKKYYSNKRKKGKKMSNLMDNPMYIVYLVFMILNAITNIILFGLMVRFYLNGVKFYKTNQYKQFNDIQIYELRKELESIKHTSNIDKDKKIIELTKELQTLKQKIKINLESKTKTIETEN